MYAHLAEWGGRGRGVEEMGKVPKARPTDADCFVRVHCRAEVDEFDSFWSH